MTIRNEPGLKPYGAGPPRPKRPIDHLRRYFQRIGLPSHPVTIADPDLAALYNSLGD